MFRDKKAPGIQNEDAQIASALSVDFLRDVGAIHPGSDDNRIEREAAIVDSFIVGVTDVSTQYVERKRGFLHFNGVRSFLKIANHVVLLRAGLLRESGTEF